ncbi:hypothetical protein [Schaalia suimastitidis]|uniref:hypothetical protein n=1 Tax=Schaalia suimastitidis TaxID=121163 RepID=UPI00047A6B08|nr:hypothetical protein [Schaalia suimastitidis]
MKTLMRTLVVTMTTLALCVATGVGAGAVPRQEVSVIPPQTSFVLEGEEPEAQPAAASGVVVAVLAVLSLGYAVARDDGIARAAAGQITWSQWNGSIGWAIFTGANSLGVAGVVGYQGWKNGFVSECPKHRHCWNR